jgi:hypothetical protein
MPQAQRAGMDAWLRAGTLRGRDSSAATGGAAPFARAARTCGMTRRAAAMRTLLFAALLLAAACLGGADAARVPLALASGGPPAVAAAPGTAASMPPPPSLLARTRGRTAPVQATMPTAIYVAPVVQPMQAQAVSHIASVVAVAVLAAVLLAAAASSGPAAPAGHYRGGGAATEEAPRELLSTSGKGGTGAILTVGERMRLQQAAQLYHTMPAAAR